MPYIAEDGRKKLRETARKLGEDCIGPGELNYAITSVILSFLGPEQHRHYYHYNEAIGVLEGAKLELYRMAVAPYEDEKIKLNGKVV
jgi:hypothetical protein